MSLFLQLSVTVEVAMKISPLQGLHCVKYCLTSFDYNLIIARKQTEGVSNVSGHNLDANRPDICSSSALFSREVHPGGFVSALPSFQTFLARELLLRYLHNGWLQYKCNCKSKVYCVILKCFFKYKSDLNYW